MSSRPRLLLRGIVALGLAFVFAGFAVGAPFVEADAEIIAPAVAAGVAAISLSGLAMSAFALYDKSMASALPGYRIARWGVPAVPVAGLATGVVTWLVSGDATIMGVAVWGTGIVWLVLLLLIARHSRDMRLATAVAAAPGSALG